MRNALNRWLASYLEVRTEEPRVAQRGRALLILLLIMEALSLLSVLQVLLFFPVYNLLPVIGGGILSFGLLIIFTRQGKVWPPYVFLMFFVGLIYAVIKTSVYSPMVLAYAFPIVMAPLVAEPWLALVIAVFEGIVVYIGLARLGDPSMGIVPVMLFGGLGAIAWITSANLQRALAAAEHSADALKVTNQALEAGQVLLEARTREVERRARYLEATSEVARDVASELALQDLLERIVRLVGLRFGFYHAAVFLLDDSREWAVLQAASSLGGQRMLARGYQVRVGSPNSVGQVTQQGQSQIASDVEAAGAFESVPDLPDTRSMMTLPLRVRGEITGALDVHSTTLEAFTPEDAIVLQGLADQLAMAIGNARLFAQLQQSLEAQRQAYGEIDREAWRALLSTRADFNYRSNARGVFKIAGDMWPAETERVLHNGEVFAGVDSTYPDHYRLAVPVRVPSGDIVGVIDTYKPAAEGEWTPDEKTLLQEISERLGGALESAQFYYESQRRAAREQLTREITDEMRRSIDMETILRTVVTSLGQAVGAPRTYIRLTLNEDALPEGAAPLAGAEPAGNGSEPAIEGEA